MEIESFGAVSLSSLKGNDYLNDGKSSGFYSNSNSTNLNFDIKTNQESDNDSNSLSKLNVTSRIKYLEEELINAQADKEFVWSLWRQLQSTNPDVTNAISTVVQREKEKTEQKDRKVLEILQVKDEKIDELYKAFKSKEKECADLKETLKKVELQLQTKTEEAKFLEMNTKTLSDKEQMFEQMLRGKDDKYEKAIRDHDVQVQQLLAKIRDLVKENAETQEHKFQLGNENQKNKDTIEILNRQVKQVNESYEKLISELNEFQISIDNSLKQENDKLKIDLKLKSEQSEKLRKELNELWSKFNENVDYTNQQEKHVKQLKSNQNELHNTIKSQQKAFESENEQLRRMYDQISEKYEEKLRAEKQIMNETKLAQQQQHHQQVMQIQQIKINDKTNCELIKALQYEIDQLKLQITLKDQQINDKQLICDELNRRLDEFEIVYYQVC